MFFCENCQIDDVIRVLLHKFFSSRPRKEFPFALRVRTIRFHIIEVQDKFIFTHLMITLLITLLIKIYQTQKENLMCLLNVKKNCQNVLPWFEMHVVLQPIRFFARAKWVNWWIVSTPIFGGTSCSSQLPNKERQHQCNRP